MPKIDMMVRKGSADGKVALDRSVAWGTTGSSTHRLGFVHRVSVVVVPAWLNPGTSGWSQNSQFWAAATATVPTGCRGAVNSSGHFTTRRGRRGIVTRPATAIAEAAVPGCPTVGAPACSGQPSLRPTSSLPSYLQIPPLYLCRLSSMSPPRLAEVHTQYYIPSSLSNLCTSA